MYKETSSLQTFTPAQIGRLVIPIVGGYEIIDTSQILYLKSDNTYTHFFLENGETKISSLNIGEYEHKLLGLPFMRIHNSYMVNLLKISKYIKADKAYVMLQNKKSIEIDVSRSGNNELRQYIQNGLQKEYFPLKFGRLSIKSDAKNIEFVDIHAVIHIESEDEETYFYLEHKQELHSKHSIGEYEKTFSHLPFMRVHNSYMINLIKIAKFTTVDGYTIIMENKKAIPVSRGKKEVLELFLKQ